MLRRRWILWAAICAVGGLFAADCVPASAIGYYNLPGSFYQCFGYGNGAGHHACLVLGPSTCGGCCATNEVRLQYPPQPPRYCAGCGEIDSNNWLDAPSTLSPVGPEPLPAPTAMRPQILR